jgi:glycosyltransferase involved in cell wall biosynthesis
VDELIDGVGRGAVGGAPTETVTIVVPCFDEARRLDPVALRDLALAVMGRVLLVDDGSTDGTAELARQAADEHPEQLGVLVLDRNRGKGEAVRLGMRAALDDGAELTGYYDADLATPPAEMARLVATLRDDPALAAVLGSRVALLGHDIQRSAARHYLGRLFATASSLVLGLRVYDTQCGAKVFRGGPPLRAALDAPFASRWAFDVELLGRLHREGGEPLLEVPLVEWRDVDGSKLRPRDAVTASFDLVRVARVLGSPARRQPGAIGSSNSPTVNRAPRRSSSA